MLIEKTSTRKIHFLSLCKNYDNYIKLNLGDFAFNPTILFLLSLTFKGRCALSFSVSLLHTLTYPNSNKRPTATVSFQMRQLISAQVIQSKTSYQIKQCLDEAELESGIQSTSN